MRGYSSSGRAAGSQSAGGGFESHWLQELNGTLYGVPFFKNELQQGEPGTPLVLGGQA